MKRRTFLGVVGAGGSSLAGCLDSSDAAGDGSGRTDAAAGETTNAGADENRIENHPAAADLAAQPRLGPDPFESAAVVVAFEDPSCPTCRRFETGAFPDLKADYFDAGRATFVYRNYPIIYPWGKPAVQALEATFARDEAAFWALKDHYFAEQSSFDTDNVLDRTRTFLAASTHVDAEAVVRGAGEKAYDAAVRADLDAGEAAGASATPTFVLFRDGGFVTKVTGAKSAAVFETALGL